MDNSERMKMRENIIGYFYSSELMNEIPNSTTAFEVGDFTRREMNIIESICSKYPRLKKLILKYTKESWSWERIAPLNRALLIYGAYEIYFTDKALIIDVMVTLAKQYSPDDSYKFINSILDKIGDFYAEIKSSKKSSEK